MTKNTNNKSLEKWKCYPTTNYKNNGEKMKK